LPILFTIVLSLVVLIAIDLLSYALRRTGWMRFASTFFLFYAQILVTEFVLGLFSALTGPNLALLNLVLSAGLVVLLHRKFGRNLGRKYLKGLDASVVTIWRDLRADPLSLILLVLSGLMVIWVIFLGVLFPVIDFDGNSYHMTFIANVMQYHNFADVPTSLRWLTGYPKAGEFIQMWSVILSRNDMLADLAQVPFAILGVYSLYHIAVAVGADKKQARFAALLFIFVPEVINELKTTYVDVMLTSLFFAGVAMLVRRPLKRLDWILVGIVISLLIGVKSTGVLFVAALLPLIAWNLYQSREPHSKPWVNLWRPLLLVIGPTFFGLYWYIKNLVLYGSPIYPFGFKLLGERIFPGQTFQEFAANAVDGTTSLPAGYLHRIWYVWTERRDWYGCFYNYDTNYAGLGPIWFVVLLPAILMATYFAIKGRRWLFLFVSGLTGVLYLAYPANYYARYTFFVVLIGILGLALTLTSIHTRFANAVKIFTLGLVLLVAATNFTLCNTGPDAISQQLKTLFSATDRGATYQYLPGPAFVYMEQKLKASDVVVYDSSPYFIYPLWKPDFSNKVIYIPAANKSEWNHKLQDNHATYVFTSIKSKEYGWAVDNLPSIYKDAQYEVFKVR
jgi:hypothetical protein